MEGGDKWPAVVKRFGGTLAGDGGGSYPWQGIPCLPGITLPVGGGVSQSQPGGIPGCI